MRRGGEEGLKGKERRFEVNMHYTLFPFPLPYYLPLCGIDYSMHSDGVLIEVMVGCGVDNVPRVYRRRLMRGTHEHRANAVHVALTDRLS